MAFPRTITGFEFTGTHNGGPYLVNGNYYVVSADSTSGGVKIFSPGSSTDATWSEIDASNAPAPAANVADSLNSKVSGNNIHIVWFQNNAGSWDAYYARFDCSTDTWQTITGGNKYNTLVTGAFNLAGMGVDIAIRSDGDLVVGLNGGDEKVHGTSYQRVYYTVSTDSGANWGTLTDLGGTGAQNGVIMSAAQLGSSDRTHFFYLDDLTTDELNHRVLTSADSLQTENSNRPMANHFYKSKNDWIDVNICRTIGIPFPSGRYE